MPIWPVTRTATSGSPARAGEGSQIPYSVCGNGGHNVQRIALNGALLLHAPQLIQAATRTNDQIVSKTMTIRTTGTFAYSQLRGYFA
jgi:hypothetical protein